MTGAELAPLELAGRLALAFGLAVFLGLAFEEVYKREDRSSPGGVRTFPMLAVSGAMLYLIEPPQGWRFAPPRSVRLRRELLRHRRVRW